MVCAPGFGAFGVDFETFGNLVHALVNDLYRHMALIFFEHFLAELLLEVFTDNEHYFAESGAQCVENGVVHYGFAGGADAVKLFEAAVAATHAGGKDK